MVFKCKATDLGRSKRAPESDLFCYTETCQSLFQDGKAARAKKRFASFLQKKLPD
jgi:hypothetical protein